MDLKVNSTKPITFKAVEYNMAKDLLVSQLSDKQWNEFMKIVEAQKENPVNVTLFGDKYTGMFSGMVSCIGYLGRIIPTKLHSQYLFFESPLGFIKRMVKSAEKEKNRVFGTME